MKLANINSAKAFAPATSANFAVGYDLLGFALESVGDTVELIKKDDNDLIIKQITGTKGADKLPFDSDKNVVTAVIKKFLADKNINIGFDVYINKGITLGSGMGGSAASSVAALVAMNAFFEKPYSYDELIDYAIYGESLISGAFHGDNAVSCMFGGLVLLQNSKPCKKIQLPIADCKVAIVCPDLSIETKKARELLKESYDLSKIVEHSACLASVISALYTQDLDLLGENLKDVLIEPRRAKLITGFYDVKDAAYKAGALACGISGSGPTMFALAKEDNIAKVTQAMQNKFNEFNLESDSWISSMSKKGAYLLEKK
ncbi:homoserine kinase [Francisella halioticida]|uniref:Homoserine kinase n=1 Tax=Francisella halioticida TaxID=549298 RepID=A0ABM6M0P6_9GAMM|nr:homoserine kinase [Francisella halioticida]ASG68420.1 homoserine kinase [Francisella halioticida]BCD91293.1 homoserine kinase [Francisella halioticida]